MLNIDKLLPVRNINSDIADNNNSSANRRERRGRRDFLNDLFNCIRTFSAYSASSRVNNYEKTTGEYNEGDKTARN